MRTRAALPSSGLRPPSPTLAVGVRQSATQVGEGPTARTVAGETKNDVTVGTAVSSAPAHRLPSVGEGARRAGEGVGHQPSWSPPAQTEEAAKLSPSDTAHPHEAPQSAHPLPSVGEGARRAGEGARPPPRSFAPHTVDSPKQIARARTLRRRSTEAERTLWSLLRDRRLAGHKFRRQESIGPYIVDFVCFDARLVIELDGSQHFGDAHDVARDAELTHRGFEVLRVWNSELNGNRNGVLDTVWAALVRRTGDSEPVNPPPSSGLRPPSPTLAVGVRQSATQVGEGPTTGVASGDKSSASPSAQTEEAAKLSQSTMANPHRAYQSGLPLPSVGEGARRAGEGGEQSDAAKAGTLE